MTDTIFEIFEKSGLLTSHDCLACDVCCRFGEAESSLAPFFSNAEVGQALTAGLEQCAFLPGNYGPGQSVVLKPHESFLRCPAFRPRSNDCAIYADRPLDCRLYPFMLMFDKGGRHVRLGLDSLCPVLSARKQNSSFDACVRQLADQLDGPLLAAVVARRGMVTDWKEHIRPLCELASLSRALCHNDLGLSRLVPSALHILRPFFEAHAGALFTHAFATVYVWSDVFDLRWKITGERLLIFAEGEGDCFLIAPPLGRGDAREPAREALRIMRRLNPHGVSPRIQDAEDLIRAELIAAGWRVRETTVEYVHRRGELGALRGNRYEKKRQMCNRFERDHAWQWRAFAPEDFLPAVALTRRWLAHQCAAHPETFFVAQAEASFRCIYRGLRDAKALGLTVRVLEADGRLVGLTAGLPLHDGESFTILFEVADLTVRGAAQFMFRQLCREMDGFTFVNAGGASNLPNLARVKESYKPSRRLSSHVLIPR